MVISEELRILLYPLGILSTLAFTARFIIQWLASERAHASVVNAPFWWLSLFGNASLGIHSLIQGQYPVCLVQAINGVIAVRNLNLMKPLAFQWRRETVIKLLILSIVLVTYLFWQFSFEAWFRSPKHAFQNSQETVSFFWHIIGSIGVILFASRFWVQWIQAERAHKSILDRPFWWLSLFGALFSILYFAKISDYVNLVGPLFGMIPYLRNLMLMKKADGKT